MNRLKDFWGEEGATSSEYALMVGLIAMVIIASVATFGQAVLRLFERWPLL